jgi:hypothetical protein
MRTFYPFIQFITLLLLSRFNLFAENNDNLLLDKDIQKAIGLQFTTLINTDFQPEVASFANFLDFSPLFQRNSREILPWSRPNALAISF